MGVVGGERAAWVLGGKPRFRRKRGKEQISSQNDHCPPGIEWGSPDFHQHPCRPQGAYRQRRGNHLTVTVTASLRVVSSELWPMLCQAESLTLTPLPREDVLIAAELQTLRVRVLIPHQVLKLVPGKVAQHPHLEPLLPPWPLMTLGL